MGAWGVRPFENDDAADFLSELMDVPASERTQLLLAALTLPGGYLEAPQASVAVAAAALVAAHNGMPVTEPVVENPPHPGGVPDGQLRVQASAALSRVNSEDGTTCGRKLACSPKQPPSLKPSGNTSSHDRYVRPLVMLGERHERTLAGLLSRLFRWKIAHVDIPGEVSPKSRCRAGVYAVEVGEQAYAQPFNLAAV